MHFHGTLQLQYNERLPSQKKKINMRRDGKRKIMRRIEEKSRKEEEEKRRRERRREEVRRGMSREFPF